CTKNLREINLNLLLTSTRKNPYYRYSHRGVEQLVARRAHNPKVGGSNPPPATTNGGFLKTGSRFFYFRYVLKRCLRFTLFILPAMIRYILVIPLIWSSGCYLIISWATDGPNTFVPGRSYIPKRWIRKRKR